MATRITFSLDVTRVSTASNVSGSIRWHVYDRTVAGRSGIYVQRELAGVLQPEQQILFDGDRPEIFFDTGLLQWILLYRFNERFLMLRYTETEAPVIEVEQVAMTVSPPTPTGIAYTPIDQFQTGSSDAAQYETIAERQSILTESVPSVDAYNGPPPPEVGVGSSPTLGNFRIRWWARTTSITDGNAQYEYEPVRVYIAGFHIYRRRFDSGALERVTPTMIPFTGFILYEYDTLGVGGTYFVTQINRQGPASTNLVEGRVRSPRDTVRDNGQTLPDVVEAFMDSKMGTTFNDLRFKIVTFGAVLAIPPIDTFPSHMGDGGVAPAEVDAGYTTQFVGDIGDSFPSHLGDGMFARIEQSGFDPVVLG